MKRGLYLFAFAVLLGGCSVLNPYKSEFTCPQKENGKCVGVETAYDESLQKKNKYESLEPASQNLPGKSSTGQAEKVNLLYQEEVYRKLTGLLRDPVTPLIAPPRVMRVLLLPYTGDGGELFMPRYVYFMADDPRWIMGDYLKEGATD
ncbi:MAG: type IV conjugative transfer system lipoprotein TraV [Syntrophaceae bacterium]|nr:type IV conjugative transfer system lipoprotein TraV [Syntrophaceae bacterium]